MAAMAAASRGSLRSSNTKESGEGNPPHSKEGGKIRGAQSIPGYYYLFHPGKDGKIPVTVRDPHRDLLKDNIFSKYIDMPLLAPDITICRKVVSIYDIESGKFLIDGKLEEFTPEWIATHTGLLLDGIELGNLQRKKTDFWNRHFVPKSGNSRRFVETKLHDLQSSDEPKDVEDFVRFLLLYQVMMIWAPAGNNNFPRWIFTHLEDINGFCKLAWARIIYKETMKGLAKLKKRMDNGKEGGYIFGCAVLLSLYYCEKKNIRPCFKPSDGRPPMLCWGKNVSWIHHKTLLESGKEGAVNMRGSKRPVGEKKSKEGDLESKSKRTKNIPVAEQKSDSEDEEIRDEGDAAEDLITKALRLAWVAENEEKHKLRNMSWKQQSMFWKNEAWMLQRAKAALERDLETQKKNFQKKIKEMEEMTDPSNRLIICTPSHDDLILKDEIKDERE